MNERIKELAEQAEDDVIADHRGDEFHKAYTQRFAELIVRECCDVLQTETIRHEGYGYNQGALHQKIKEHFGVEE